MKRWILPLAVTTPGVMWFRRSAGPRGGADRAGREGTVAESTGFDPYTMAEMMKWFHVPAVSIAVVRDFQVQWTKTYGVADMGTNAPVASETRFQAASISEPVTAFAVSRAVGAGKLSHDENVNKYLKSWRVPENQYTRGGVTLRALLSHTSGTGAGFGFPGYNPSAPLPTLEEIVDGKPPSNLGPVFWERAPFTAFRYSGSGIEIVQMVLQDVYGKLFAEIIRGFPRDPKSGGASRRTPKGDRGVC